MKMLQCLIRSSWMRDGGDACRKPSSSSSKSTRGKCGTFRRCLLKHLRPPLPSQRTQQANTKYQDIDTALMQKRRRFSIKYIAGNHHPRL